MSETLTFVGLMVMAVALRMARTKLFRKLGALTALVASFYLFYVLTGKWWGGAIGVVLWLFLPCVELFGRVRKLRIPLDNKLSYREIPNPSFFPNAIKASTGMEEAGFEHVSNCGWEWAGMTQFFQVFWHPEERAVASICLCEQSDVAFAFVSITSCDMKGRVWRTTNFPFSPTLQSPPDVRWNHVPCERSCFHQILADHHQYLKRLKIDNANLKMPDPEHIEEAIEEEMRKQVEHNLSVGYILPTGDGNFQYSKRGMIFLWGQFVKDMIRLC